MNFVVIDFIFIFVIAVFVLRCFLKGFVSEVLSMAAVVLGLIASIYFYKTGGAFIAEKYMPNHEAIASVIAFIALFLIVYIVVRILAIMLKNIVEGIRLGGVDRFLGVIFGLAEGFVVVSLVLFVIQIQPLFDPEPILSDSFFAGILLPFIAGIGSA
jgi:membrane protein required for colicin V production